MIGSLYTQKIHSFFALFYHLRKTANGSNFHVDELLKRLNLTVIPKILHDIISKNVWDEESNKMKVDPSFFLTL